VDGKELPSTYDFVQQKSTEDNDDPSLTDPGAEAGDEGEFMAENPVLGHTGREVNITQPNLSGSYGRGPEIENSWANGNAPEGTRIAAKNVTGYIVSQPKVLPPDNRVPGTFGDIDDILNNHATGDARESMRQSLEPEEAYYESSRLPYSTW
jgi:hypothetical protein